MMSTPAVRTSRTSARGSLSASSTRASATIWQSQNGSRPKLEIVSPTGVRRRLR